MLLLSQRSEEFLDDTGETMRFNIMRNWWTGMVVGKMESDGLYLLVQKTENINPKYPPLVRKVFPGGTRWGHPEDRGAIDTGSRELREETGLRLKDGVIPKFLCTFISHRGRPIQMAFYFVWYEDCEGKLRDKDLIDGGQKISPPRWVKIEEVGWTLFATHQKALIATLQDADLVGR